MADVSHKLTDHYIAVNSYSNGFGSQFAEDLQHKALSDH